MNLVTRNKIAEGAFRNFKETDEAAYAEATLGEDKILRDAFEVGREAGHAEADARSVPVSEAKEDYFQCRYCGTQYGYEETCHDPQCRDEAEEFERGWRESI